MPSTNIRRLSTASAHLIAFEIRDGITRQDVEWMADEVAPAFDAGEIVDLLVILRSYKGLEPGAVFDAKAAAAQARSAFHVRRYAVVGAPDWVEAVIRLMDPFVPVQTTTFRLEDERLAWDWITSAT